MTKPIAKKTTPTKKPTKGIKRTYVLDTNVLLHDGTSLYKFKEHNIVIPVEVLEELDNKKTVPGELGVQARYVNRELKKLFGTSPRNIKSHDISVTLPSGSRLSMVVTPADFKHDDILASSKKMDNLILRCGLYLQQKLKDTKVIMVTKDSNMHLKALAVGLPVEDYKNDRIEAQTQGYSSIEVKSDVFAQLLSTGTMSLDVLKLPTVPRLSEYFIVTVTGESRQAGIQCTGISGSNITFRKCITYPGYTFTVPGSGAPITIKNIEQAIVMDALLSPTTTLVTCIGPAGTGKTFLAIAAAVMQATGNKQAYASIHISRPVVTIGKDLGFLPGSKEEKLAPFLQPYFDNLDSIYQKKVEEVQRPESENLTRKDRKQMRNQTQKQQEKGPAGRPPKPYDWLFTTGLVEMEAMTYIRGRSIAKSFMIIDEAQNMTPHEAKTVVTRMAEGSKLVLIGDPSQVDVPTMDAFSNGLVYTCKAFTGQPLSANVFLTKSVRSLLAETAARLM